MTPGFQRWASGVARGARGWASVKLRGARGWAGGVERGARNWASVLLCAASLGGCASQRGADLATTTRWVVAPSAIAVLTPSDVRSDLPAQLELGGVHGRSALYLKFPSKLRFPQVPRAAYIALSGASGSSDSSTPVMLEAWRITSAWDPKKLVTWSAQPHLAPPFARTRLTGANGANGANGADGADGAEEQRIDVSQLVQFAAQHPDLDFGIALIARGGSGRGLSVTTGIAGGRAPRLEVYVR